MVRTLLLGRGQSGPLIWIRDGIYCRPKCLSLLRIQGISVVMEQVFYLLTTRNGNRPTESMKSHAFCGVAGSSGNCVVWVYEIQRYRVFIMEQIFCFVMGYKPLREQAYRINKKPCIFVCVRCGMLHSFTFYIEMGKQVTVSLESYYEEGVQCGPLLWIRDLW